MYKRQTLDLALITGVPNNPQLSVLRVADDPLYVAMIADDDLAVNREVYLSCIHNRNWIFLGRQASPYLYDTFQIVASDKGAIAADISYVMTSEEASELIHEHKGGRISSANVRLAHCP